MKLSWNLAIHITLAGWLAFVTSAVASGHASWWMTALAASGTAVDGILSNLPQSQDPTK